MSKLLRNISKSSKKVKGNEKKQGESLLEGEAGFSGQKMTKNRRDSKNDSGKNMTKRQIYMGDSASDSDDYSDAEEAWVCKLCSKNFNDKNSKIMECERCEDRFCTECIGMKASEYKVMASRKDVHWFCAPCEPKAKKSWEQDKLFERKMREFEGIILEKMRMMEERLESKILESKRENSVQREIQQVAQSNARRHARREEIEVVEVDEDEFEQEKKLSGHK